MNAGAVLFGGTSEEGKDDITAVAGQHRIRLEGSAQTEDGAFGGWMRWGDGGTPGVNGYAWWKPIDMLKIQIGSNGDGHWGVDNIVGWNFAQTVYDADWATNTYNNVWSGSGLYGWNGVARNAIFGGWNDGGGALMFELTPMDMLSINLGFPLASEKTWEDAFKGLLAQVNLNLAFGGIHLTFRGAPTYYQSGDGAAISASLDLSAIENVGLNVGATFQMPNEDETSNPIWAGLGVKVGISDLFSIRLRTYAGFGGEDESFKLTADVNPYLTLNDNLRVSFTVGFAMLAPKDGDSTIGFNLNPYIEVGQEWGPKFVGGFKLTSDGSKDSKDNGIITWAVAVGILTSF
jgi:hypothetical protein